MADQRQAAGVLLARARDDLDAARLLLETPATDAIVGFLAQQAVEKALKAILVSRGVDYPFTHDIRRLLERCADVGVVLPGDLAGADVLSAFAGRLRYDAPPAEPIGRSVSLGLASRAMEAAAAIVTT